MINILKKENENKPCYKLLKILLNDEYEGRSNTVFIHPLAILHPLGRASKRWDWLQQASKTFCKVERLFYCSPSPELKIYNLVTQNINSFSNQNEINNYNCEYNTIPINPSSNRKLKAPISVAEIFVNGIGI